MPTGNPVETETAAPTESAMPEDVGASSQTLDFAALAAELEAEEAAAAGESPPAEEPSEEPAAEDDSADEDATEEPSEAPEPAEDSDEEIEVPSPALEAIQRKEKRAAQRLEQERAELAKMKAEIEAAQKQFEQARDSSYLGIDDLKQSLKVDPAGTLQRIGIDAADWEDVSKAIYGASPAAADNPGARQTAAQLQAQQRTQAQFKALQDKIAELESRETERVAAAEFSSYAAKVAKTAEQEAPLTAKLLASYDDPKTLNQDLRAIVTQLERETGEKPDPQDVIERIEKMERRRLEEVYGLDVDSIINTKPKTKPKKAAEAKTASPRTISSDLGTKTAPRDGPLSYEEAIQKAIKDAEEGRFED